MFWRVAIGQAMAPDHMLGRLFSPMVEFLAVRDFKPGASTDWDVLPEMQITISRRQHVRIGFGVRSSGTAARQVTDGEREGRQDASGDFFSHIGTVCGLS